MYRTRPKRRTVPRRKYGVIVDNPKFMGEIQVDGKVVWSGRKSPGKKILQFLERSPNADISVSWRRVGGTLIVRAAIPVPRRAK